MPTLLQIFGFRFYIYSEEHEPIHIHVDYGDAWAKIELEPTVTLVFNHGMKQKELKKALGWLSYIVMSLLLDGKSILKNDRNGTYY